MKVLVAQARAAANGGAEAYAAALADVVRAMGHDVGMVDVDGHVMPCGGRQPLPLTLPGPTLWNWAQVCRALPRLAAQYDRVILAFGEGPVLPVPTLSIRHAPAIFGTSPALLRYLGARPTLTRRGYVRLCRSWAHVPRPDPAERIVANTSWTAGQAARLDGTDVDGVLYPPLAPIATSAAPRHRFRLLTLGRFARNKRIEEAVQVLDRLREHGLPAELEVMGHVADHYGRRLARTLAAHPHVTLSVNASGAEKARALAEATLGLQMFRGEHFGISVAEMIRSGVVPLVFDDGGVRELVSKPDLRFRTVDQASDIALGLLTRPDRRSVALQQLTRGAALTRALNFEAEARAVLGSFLDPARSRNAA